MFKKILILICFLQISILGAEQMVSKETCENNEEGFVFAGGECINYAMFEGDDNEDLIVLVHGTWPEGTNILGRYEPFAETLNLNTDKTVIAIALPGYSKSSTNKLLAINNKAYDHQASNEDYITFLNHLMNALKSKYESKRITFVGHSAGARLGAVLAGKNPEVFTNIVLVGGRYERVEKDPKNTILPSDVLKHMNKDSKFIMVYGSVDKVSKPEITISFYEKMKKSGLNVTLVNAQGAPHLDLDMTDSSVEAISELFEEE
jgi:predicted esterase